MGLQAVKYGLSPLWIAQGVCVRRTVVMLPEPDGARMGQRGSGPLLRLMIVGDSAAAGVGVAVQSDALLGRTVSALDDSYTVDWTLIAKTGATAAGTLKRLQAAPAIPCDVAITSIGVNDVTANRSAAAYDADMVAVITLLKTKFAAKLVIVSGFPPVGQFPALPQPLRWFLGAVCRQRDAALRARVEATPAAAISTSAAWTIARGSPPTASILARRCMRNGRAAPSP